MLLCGSQVSVARNLSDYEIELEQLLRVKNEELRLAKAEFQELDQQYDELERLNKKTIADRDAAKNECAQWSSAYNSLVTVRTNLEARVRNLENQVSTLQTSLNNASNKAADLQRALNNVNNDRVIIENNRLQSKWSLVESLLPVLKYKEGADLDAECRRLARIESSLNEKELHYIQMVALARDRAFEIQRKNQEVQDLKNIVQQSQSALQRSENEWQSKVNLLSSEITALRKAKEESRDIIEFLKKELERKNQILDRGGVDYAESDRVYQENVAVKREMSQLRIAAAEENERVRNSCEAEKAAMKSACNSEVSAAREDRDRQVQDARDRNAAMLAGGVFAGVSVSAVVVFLALATK